MESLLRQIDSPWELCDLVIYERSGAKQPVTFKPRLAIELKWRRKKISTKDRKSLRAALGKLNVRKGYFVTTNIGSDNYVRTKKKKGEKYHLHEIVVQLPKETNVAEWLALRQKIKAIKDISERKTIQSVIAV